MKINGREVVASGRLVAASETPRPAGAAELPPPAVVVPPAVHLPGWIRGDITSAGTSAGPMPRAGGPASGYEAAMAGIDGEVEALWAALDGAVGAGQSYTLTLYVSRWDGAAYGAWTATDLTLTLDNTVNAGMEEAGGVNISRRDLLALYDQRTAGAAARACQAGLILRED